MRHFCSPKGLACSKDARDLTLEVTTVWRNVECPECLVHMPADEQRSGGPVDKAAAAGVAVGAPDYVVQLQARSATRDVAVATVFDYAGQVAFARSARSSEVALLLALRAARGNGSQELLDVALRMDPGAEYAQAPSPLPASSGQPGREAGTGQSARADTSAARATAQAAATVARWLRTIAEQNGPRWPLRHAAEAIEAGVPFARRMTYEEEQENPLTADDGSVPWCHACVNYHHKDTPHRSSEKYVSTKDLREALQGYPDSDLLSLARTVTARALAADAADEARPSHGFDLVQHLHRQRAFSERTFGPGSRTEGVLDHLRRELVEVEQRPHDLFEWVDVVLLALDGAWRHGFAPEQIAEALAAKQAKNEARTWPDWRTADRSKAIQHVRAPGVAEPVFTATDAATRARDAAWHERRQEWNRVLDEALEPGQPGAALLQRAANQAVQEALEPPLGGRVPGREAQRCNAVEVVTSYCAMCGRQQLKIVVDGSEKFWMHECSPPQPVAPPEEEP